MGRNGQEVTTTFKVDILELKANIQEANRQIRLANSEFRKASSGMDDWGRSADGISAKITQLNTVIDSQESILDDLTKQYEKTAAEKGEDSNAAQELQIKIHLLTSDLNKKRVRMPPRSYVPGLKGCPGNWTPISRSWRRPSTPRLN